MDWQTVILGLVMAVAGIIVLWLNNTKNLMNRIDQLTAQVFKNQNDLLDCEKKHAETDRKLQDALYDVSQYQRRLDHLERVQGILSSNSIPGMVILDADRNMMEVSPAVALSLGWLPDELRGRMIDTIIVTEFLQEFKEKFGALVKHVTHVLPSIVSIQLYMLDRHGRRAAMTMILRKWGTGPVYVTAVLQSRPSSTAVDPTPLPPTKT